MFGFLPEECKWPAYGRGEGERTKCGLSMPLRLLAFHLLTMYVLPQAPLSDAALFDNRMV